MPQGFGARQSEIQDVENHAALTHIWIMATIAFDTLKFANKLKAAGLPSEQAEAQAEALAEVIDVNVQDLVTKDDIVASLKDLEQRLIIKLGGMMVVAVGVIVTLVRFIS
ncbi:hypothetical protein [Acidithiobacillus sp.]|uniref:hypothetical protein n=1 Tax=Acidithiobacillus sp. TaxID=1872118 RepID=UPI002327BA3E|nr:hypothetical protein [Acidithiobacillus sp.]MDA8247167.1 hypothetical protein [Acidithiobacillus sp.]UBU63596.1 hypothetical protein LDB30_06275 [Acidithiobacillus ferrooxidans]